MTAVADRAGTGLRVYAYDAFRGAAMLVMVVDHLAYVAGGPQWVRLSVGRLAVPMFFVLAGHLARSPRWRHLGVAVLGLVLPVLVPWVDNTNVLVWWAMGVVVLWACRLASVPAWAVIVVALTCAANGWVDVTGFEGAGTYDARSLWALMAVGVYLPASTFAPARRLPGWVAALGRHPVAFYAGHLLLLEGLVVTVT